MRISDWSSDVCSSDLRQFELWWIPTPIFDGLIMRHLNIRFQVLIPMVSIGFCYRPGGLMQAWFTREEAKNHLHHNRGMSRASLKIGSGTCRERVCQYV